MKHCAYCGLGNDDSATSCGGCGTSEFKKHDAGSAESLNLIAEVLAATDAENKHWSPKEVRKAQEALATRFNGVPSMEHLHELFGQAKTEETVRRVLEERVEYLRTVGSVPVPEDICHGCKAKGEVAQFPFGLAKIISSKRDWSGTVASLGLSAIAVPVVGHAFLSSPVNEQTAHILEFELQLCHACVQRRRGFLNRIKLGQKDYALHPRWKPAMEAGFKQFLSPDELKRSS